MIGSLNTVPLLRASLVVPRWGIWWVDVEATDSSLSGAASLVLADLTLAGTILPGGGSYAGRSYYRIVGGAAGWSKRLLPKSYRAQIGVKLSTVVTDAANEVRETMAPFLDSVIGIAFVRPPKGEAARVLDLVAPEGWYVDEAGVTHIGVRPAATYSAPYVLLEKRPDRLSATIAPTTLTGLVPGVTLEGFTVADVRHELTGEGLRTHLFGVQGVTPSSRFWQSIARIVRQQTRPFTYFGLYEYRVTSQSGPYLDMVPTDTTLGLPPIANCGMRAGSPGAAGDPQNGSVVYVQFVNGQPTRPRIVSYDGEADGGFLPLEARLFASVDVKIGDATATLLARADKVSNELAQIQAAHNSHTHVVSVPITGVAGTTAGTSSPTTTTYTPGAVACALAKGT